MFIFHCPNNSCKGILQFITGAKFLPDEFLPPFACNVCGSQFMGVAAKDVKLFKPQTESHVTELLDIQFIEKVALINEATQEVFFLSNGYNFIGRRPFSDNLKVDVANKITIEGDNYISRNHCVILIEESTISNTQTADGIIMDIGSPDVGGLASRSGTFVNGNKLHLKDKIYLENGDVISFGDKSATSFKVNLA